jgi:predicted metal-dependent hydrolase
MRIKNILEEVKSELGMKNKIKVEVKKMKTKAASVSIRNAVIRLNKNVVIHSNKQCIRYLLLHELAHIKLQSRSHGSKFYSVIYQVMNRKDVNEAEKTILNLLIQQNAPVNQKKENPKDFTSNKLILKQ